MINNKYFLICCTSMVIKVAYCKIFATVLTTIVDEEVLVLVIGVIRVQKLIDFLEKDTAMMINNEERIDQIKQQKQREEVQQQQQSSKLFFKIINHKYIVKLIFSNIQNQNIYDRRYRQIYWASQAIKSKHFGVLKLKLQRNDPFEFVGEDFIDLFGRCTDNELLELLLLRYNQYLNDSYQSTEDDDVNITTSIVTSSASIQHPQYSLIESAVEHGNITALQLLIYHYRHLLGPADIYKLLDVALSASNHASIDIIKELHHRYTQFTGALIYSVSNLPIKLQSSSSSSTSSSSLSSSSSSSSSLSSKVSLVFNNSTPSYADQSAMLYQLLKFIMQHKLSIDIKNNEQLVEILLVADESMLKYYFTETTKVTTSTTITSTPQLKFNKYTVLSLMNRLCLSKSNNIYQHTNLLIDIIENLNILNKSIINQLKLEYNSNNNNNNSSNNNNNNNSSSSNILYIKTIKLIRMILYKYRLIERFENNNKKSVNSGNIENWRILCLSFIVGTKDLELIQMFSELLNSSDDTVDQTTTATATSLNFENIGNNINIVVQSLISIDFDPIIVQSLYNLNLINDRMLRSSVTMLLVLSCDSHIAISRYITQLVAIGEDPIDLFDLVSQYVKSNILPLLSDTIIGQLLALDRIEKKLQHLNQQLQLHQQQHSVYLLNNNSVTNAANSGSVELINHLLINLRQPVNLSKLLIKLTRQGHLSAIQHLFKANIFNTDLITTETISNAIFNGDYHLIGYLLDRNPTNISLNTFCFYIGKVGSVELFERVIELPSGRDQLQQTNNLNINENHRDNAILYYLYCGGCFSSDFQFLSYLETNYQYPDVSNSHSRLQGIHYASMMGNSVLLARLFSEIEPLMDADTLLSEVDKSLVVCMNYDRVNTARHILSIMLPKYPKLLNNIPQYLKMSVDYENTPLIKYFIKITNQYKMVGVAPSIIYKGSNLTIKELISTIQ
ncbi:hypothetical protein PPL_02677 [Heterostelium album PN500]|uniref:Uncharacterized protein n=1 Tax=Heterostelium pallidum (strain ATCC 26659 / Pp 5 / PN500) TaxID=670386 RepID=D3B2R3_HETP5|nr:hypothetical protein PPL_02677 [Heterostelium album PN500]EFA83611.1 hypothetical protein PPL_02677 [Heterostelium album PN500]|eukprot:XP_020435728.1 hypothetical protein PPL_02677 [Heterostelium album PN500]